MGKRFWEIDFFRGLAIITMIIFNYAFTLSYLGVYRITNLSVFWYIFPRVIASTFIFLAGMSIVVISPKKSYIKYFNRGLKLFFLGILITIATFQVDTIWFGILHFMGISMMLAPVFLRKEKMLVPLALSTFIIGWLLSITTFSFPWLLWLGFIPTGFTTIDYFPVFPWFGIILLGMHFGNIFYRNGKRQFKLTERENIISLIGRHSLLIYVLHQPILLGVLYAAGLL